MTIDRTEAHRQLNKLCPDFHVTGRRQRQPQYTSSLLGRVTSAWQGLLHTLNCHSHILGLLQWPWIVNRDVNNNSFGQHCNLYNNFYNSLSFRFQESSSEPTNPLVLRPSSTEWASSFPSLCPLVVVVSWGCCCGCWSLLCVPHYKIMVVRLIIHGDRLNRSAIISGGATRRSKE